MPFQFLSNKANKKENSFFSKKEKRKKEDSLSFHCVVCTLYILFWSLLFNAFNGSLFKTTHSPIFSLALCLCLSFFVVVALFHLDLVDLGYRLLGKMFICFFFVVVVVLYFKLCQLNADLGWSSFWLLCVKVDYLLPKYLVYVYHCCSFWVSLIYLVMCLLYFFTFFMCVMRSVKIWQMIRVLFFQILQCLLPLVSVLRSGLIGVLSHFRFWFGSKVFGFSGIWNVKIQNYG